MWLTENEAVAKGFDVPCKVQNYGEWAITRPWSTTPTRHRQAQRDSKTGWLLGAHIMGHQASSIIQPLIQAMARSQYWIHPALREVVENALLGLSDSHATTQAALVDFRPPGLLSIDHRCPHSGHCRCRIHARLLSRNCQWTRQFRLLKHSSQPTPRLHSGQLNQARRPGSAVGSIGNMAGQTARQHSSRHQVVVNSLLLVVQAGVEHRVRATFFGQHGQRVPVLPNRLENGSPPARLIESEVICEFHTIRVNSHSSSPARTFIELTGSAASHLIRNGLGHSPH